MSVRLEPMAVINKPEYLNNPEADYFDDPDFWTVDMANGTWARMTALLTDDEREDTWNHCHDSQYYTPTQLQLIAMRLEGQDREFFAENLNHLANEGGCIVP